MLEDECIVVQLFKIGNQNLVSHLSVPGCAGKRGVDCKLHHISVQRFGIVDSLSDGIDSVFHQTEYVECVDLDALLKTVVDQKLFFGTGDGGSASVSKNSFILGFHSDIDRP